MTRLGCVLLVALLCPPSAWAQQASPDEVVRAAVEGVLATIKADPSARSGDAQHIARLVEEKFLPYTDFLHTTRLAVGEPWKSATPEQQRAVFEQFQTLLVRTYALEMTQISDQDIKFQYGPQAKPGAGGDVIVKTRLQTPSDDDEIDYRLARTAAGWRIYDINILGAWLSALYRGQFAGRLAQGGMDGLIKALHEHNSSTSE